MLQSEYAEYIAIFASLLGGFGTMITYLWIKAIKPIVKVIQSHDSVMHSIEYIKKELTTNGGNSLKDTILDLKGTCNRIEARQKVIEQRTKAALHYNDSMLFETDNEGRLIWSNENFCSYFRYTQQNLEGYDWLSCIDEDEREDLLHEFKSCLKMNRKFIRKTKTNDGKTIRMTGYPYRLNDVEQGGFLVSVSEPINKEV
jgi:PAS domain S-box-containing protein